MIQYNALLNLKLSNLQLKLKSGIKSGTQVILNLPSNMIGNSNDNTNFPHQLLLANTQVSRLCKTFANGSSDNIKLSKSQLFKMVQLGRFLGRPLGPLLKYDLSLMANALKPSAKSVLMSLGLTTAAAATDAAFPKNGGLAW